MNPNFEIREERKERRKGHSFLLIWNFPHTNTIIHEFSPFNPLEEEKKPAEQQNPKFKTKSFIYLVGVIKLK